MEAVHQEDSIVLLLGPTLEQPKQGDLSHPQLRVFHQVLHDRLLEPLTMAGASLVVTARPLCHDSQLEPPITDAASLEAIAQHPCLDQALGALTWVEGILAAIVHHPWHVREPKQARCPDRTLAESLFRDQAQGEVTCLVADVVFMDHHLVPDLAPGALICPEQLHQHQPAACLHSHL